MVDVAVLAKPSVNDAITLVVRSSKARQAAAIGILAGRRPYGDFAPAAMAETHWTGGMDDAGKVMERRLAPEFDALFKDHDMVTVNSLGEGLVNVCAEGGNIAVGDLICTSSTPGKGMRQAIAVVPDDIVRNFTVARAREAVKFTKAGEVRMIACVYLCG